MTPQVAKEMREARRRQVRRTAKCPPAGTLRDHAVAAWGRACVVGTVNFPHYVPAPMRSNRGGPHIRIDRPSAGLNWPIPLADPGGSRRTRRLDRAMPHARGIPLPEREIAELRDRSGALRQSATLPGAQLPQLLDAALAELDGAIDTAAALQAGLDPGAAGGPQADASGGERRLLGAIFSSAPVPLFVLDRDGTIRRVNRCAADLLGAGPATPTGNSSPHSWPSRRGRPCTPSLPPWPGQGSRAAFPARCWVRMPRRRWCSRSTCWTSLASPAC